MREAVNDNDLAEIDNIRTEIADTRRRTPANDNTPVTADRHIFAVSENFPAANDDTFWEQVFAEIDAM